MDTTLRRSVGISLTGLLIVLALALVVLPGVRVAAIVRVPVERAADEETVVSTDESVVAAAPSDRVTIRNGDVLTGRILNDSVTIKTPYALLAFGRDEVEGAVFGPEDGAAVRLYLKAGDCLVGTLQDETIRIKLNYGSEVEIDVLQVDELSIGSVAPAARAYGGQYALAFDGRDDFVQIPSCPQLDLKADMTVSAWVKCEEGLGDGQRQVLWRGDTRSAKDPYQLCLMEHKMGFWVNNNESATSQETVDGEWHFWSGVWDGRSGKVYLYRDGVLESAESLLEVIDYDTAGMWNMIGAVDNGGSQNFKGLIGEVRVWNTARTEDAIRRDMHRTLSGSEMGLVAYWVFDEGGGQSVHSKTPDVPAGTLGESEQPDSSEPAWVRMPRLLLTNHDLTPTNAHR